MGPGFPDPQDPPTVRKPGIPKVSKLLKVFKVLKVLGAVKLLKVLKTFKTFGRPRALDSHIFRIPRYSGNLDFQKFQNF